MRKAKVVKSGSTELPESFKKDAEKAGYVFRDRAKELSKWGKGVVVEGIFTGFKPGKRFNNRENPSTLCKFRTKDGKTLVYACPAVLYNALEDVHPGTDVMIICLGQNLAIKDRKEPAWDFEVAVKA